MDLIGIGLYTASEAARLARLPTQSVIRWTMGYRYQRDGGIHEQPPIVRRDLSETDYAAALSFRDLMEVRFIGAFRHEGVSLQAIRIAAERTAEMYGHSHPFSTSRFKTDGNRIFEEIPHLDDVKLLDVNRWQYAFHSIVKPTLYGGFEFEFDHVARWFPEHPKRRIVIDPQRSFGRPIIAEQGIPTDVLAKAVEVEGSEKEIAKWYDVPVGAVNDAVEFEQKLAA